jgi:hypothetical protein
MKADVELEAWRADWQAQPVAPLRLRKMKATFADKDLAIDAARFVDRSVRHGRVRLIATVLAAAVCAMLSVFRWPVAALLAPLLWYAWETRAELARLRGFEEPGGRWLPGGARRWRARHGRKA